DAWTVHVEQLPPLPLRTDPPPKAWKANQINDGLPVRWEKGIVHLLAWEMIGDEGPRQVTQILVLKRFNQPTEKGRHKWVLAQLFHHPKDATWPWQGAMRIPNPSPHMPEMTHAQLFGSEFYDDPPTDAQIKTFLKETSWTLFIGTQEYIFLYGKRIFTTKLTAGGIDRALWIM